MSPSLRRILSEIRHWALPGGLIVAAVGLWVLLDPDSALLREVAEVYPYAVYGLGGVLAWRLHRSRVAAALLGVTALTALPRLVDPTLHGAVRRLVAAAGAPLAWLALGIGRDRPVLSRHGMRSVGAVVLLLGGSVAVGAVWAEAVVGLLTAPLSVPGIPWSPPLELLGALVLGAGVFAVAVIRHGPVERALFWSLLASEAALAAEAGAPTGDVLLMAAGLTLGGAVVEASYADAYHDDLTGLPGRRALEHDIDRLGRSYTLAMVDVDHFKRFNDRHGHEVGDQVLRMVASRLRRAPGRGRAFRYGGEEFALLFPGIDPEETRPHLEEVRRSVERSRFVVRGPARERKGPEGRAEKGTERDREELSVTVSIGSAGPREPDEDPLDVLDRADQALYRAKEKGRNRVE